MAKIKGVLSDEEKAQLKFRENIDIHQWAKEQVKLAREHLSNPNTWKKNTSYGKDIRIDEEVQDGDQSIQPIESSDHIHEKS